MNDEMRRFLHTRGLSSELMPEDQAARGLIDIRQNAYINNITPAVYYNVHRMKRRETKHQF